jgi:predicted dehydrogenase
MNDHPVKCWGQGSRQQLGNKSGEIYDNFDVEYEYANGVRMYSYCGQIKRGWSSVSEAVHGTKGTSNPARSTSTKDGQRWTSTLKLQHKNPYVQEHIDLMNAIAKDTELNETKNVTDTTMTAIIGREAAYSGSEVTWDAMLNSKFMYGPELLYTDCAKMEWGAFRTLKPPMPSMHDIVKNPPVIAIA